jgi:cyclophilin family peptidyl-prolyl cis-trans isomerase
VTRYPVVLVALVGSVATVFAGCSTSGSPSSAPSADAFGSAPPASAAPPSEAPSTAASAGPSGSAAASGSCPTSPPAALAAGQKRVVTIETAKGKIEITVEADLGPLAAGNFVALASCGFYDGLVFHRLVPGFVIQGGDPTGTGSGGPGYSFADDPVTVPYSRGVVAMANAGPNTNGSQFFIVLADASLAPNYSVFGRVTSGLETVDGIAAMPNSGPPSNAAVTPVAMDKVTVATP